MFQSFDIFTLGVCSTLASTAFGAVFFTLWRRRPSERHLRDWAMSNWLYAFVLIALYSPAGQYAAVSCVLFALIGVSDILVVSGIYRLDRQPPFRRWMVMPILSASIGHSLPVMVGMEAGSAFSDVSEAIGLAIAMGSCGLAVLRDDRGWAASPGRKIAGLALAAYLPGYLSVIAIRIWFPQSSELLPRIPMLMDQLLLGVLNLGLLAIPAERVHERLRLAASRDPLTGVWNREGLARLAPDLLQSKGAVIAIDIDHFKAINDEHGHSSGDRVLVAVADAAQLAVEQKGGAVFRTGGDEFVAIIPECDAADGQTIADHLRASGARHGLPPWTLSIGIALVGADKVGIEKAINRADVALYQAKEQGRDRAQLIVA